MRSPVFSLYLTCLLWGEIAQTANLKSSSVHQERGFVSVKIRENLTLKCSYESLVGAKIYWYKQTLGQKPRHISTFYTYDKKIYFYGEFKNNSRFTLDAENGKNHLTITDVRISDSATYYCISCYLYTLEILASILISVQGSGLDVPVLVQQSASQTIQPGGSVTLNCTVHTGTCDGEHSVYWFRSSDESHPGLIYTHGGRNQCERKPNTQTNTCVYNLPMKSLNLSDAGTYYCAVASCGNILLGNGTKLDFEDGADSLVLMYFLSGTSTFASILSVFLAFSMCLMSKRSSCQSTESQASLSAPSTAYTKGFQHAETLYYAALSVNLHNRSRRQRDQTWSECVYYSIKQ